MDRVTTRAATLADTGALAAIYNQGILGRMATFETTLRTPADMAATLDARGALPFLVAEAGARVVGWASVSRYRARACYAGIGEFSIYVADDARGQGVGRALLPALIAAAEVAELWKLVSRVFPDNLASRRLCAACGFREVGVYEKHAQLDGVWRDVVIVERLLARAGG